MAGARPGLVRSEWGKREEFEDLMLSLDIVGFFEKPVQIKRGLFSHFYVNWRTPAGDAFLLDKITDYILDVMRSNALEPRSIYGVPEGATKWGVVTQMKWARQQPDFGRGAYPVPMGRSVPKEHGMPQDRYFVGAPSGPTVIIEDVVVEGEALLNVIDRFQSMGVPVLAVVVLTDRDGRAPSGKSVREEITAKGIKYFAMSDALSFLPRLYREKAPGRAVAAAIEAEFAQNGIKRLKLA